VEAESFFTCLALAVLESMDEDRSEEEVMPKLPEAQGRSSSRSTMKRTAALLAKALRVRHRVPKQNARPIALRIRDLTTPLLQKVEQRERERGLRPRANLRLKQGSGPCRIGRNA
jgi:hypothetical protein